MSKTFKTQIKVRYAETDQMGVVYHGNYATYLEVARIEWLENMGISYKKMEENGVQLPVVEMSFKFKKPAYFDDLITVSTTLREKPTAKIAFDFQIHSPDNELLTTAEVVLVFIDTQTNRPIRCPSELMEILTEHKTY